MSLMVYDKNEVRETLVALVRDVLKRKRLDAKAEDIVEGVSLVTQVGIDSLDILQVVAAVEKKYGLRIPEEELRSADDIGKFLKVVEKHWPKA
ncbi:MAG: acyl carrier protein [Elusimicrobiota bacterium]|jgi:acyl carrier protein